MTLMKPLILFFLLLTLQSCATARPALQHGFKADGTPVYLSDPVQIPDEIKKFYSKRDLSTEEGKIDYLIYRVQDSDLTFLRNREKYDGAAAAEFLRWKLPRHKNNYHVKVDTAEDFVSKIASESRMSGKPYAVIDSQGGRHHLQDVLQNELNLLNDQLKHLDISKQ